MVRNLVFNNCVTAISMFWDWTFAYKSLSINNCQVGIDISAGGSSSQEVGSITVYDSTFTNTPIAIKSAWTTSSSPATAGSVILENVVLNNVATAAVQSPNGNVLSGGSRTISAWGQGHTYVPNGPTTFQGTFSPPSRPGSLLSGSKYYEQSKPQFESLSVSSFVTARSFGATGNGNTDDTTALQNAINSAASSGKVLYVDAGTYKVTNTITIPAGSKIVGEAYPVILSSGGVFNNVNSPVPVVKVGNSGDNGQVQWTDMIVSTQGAQAGAILIQWNLATSGTPSGMWDVHTRIGGFAGSNLQVAQCPTSASPGAACMAAFMSMQITPSASNLYLENNWFWTADHDIDSSSNTQISIYSGRGLLVESTAGTIWFSGTAVEHHALYQYQLVNTQNIYFGQPQTETPYYQPRPTAPSPYSYQSSFNDPNFASSCSGQSGNCANAWGFRVTGSKNINVYGAGFYSFFNSYSTACSAVGAGENCQTNIVDIESSSGITIYNLNTVGVTNMVTLNGAQIANYGPNVNVFPDTIALFKTG
jgi:glucan 1,3-beta-glucosidase